MESAEDAIAYVFRAEFIEYDRGFMILNFDETSTVYVRVDHKDADHLVKGDLIKVRLEIPNALPSQPPIK